MRTPAEALETFSLGSRQAPGLQRSPVLAAAQVVLWKMRISAPSCRSTNACDGENLACRRDSTHRLHTHTALAGTPARLKRTKKATKPRPLKTCLQTLFFFSQPVSTSPLEPPATSLATSASPKGSRKRPGKRCLNARSSPWRLGAGGGGGRSLRPRQGRGEKGRPRTSPPGPPPQRAGGRAAAGPVPSPAPVPVPSHRQAKLEVLLRQQQQVPPERRGRQRHVRPFPRLPRAACAAGRAQRCGGSGRSGTSRRRCRPQRGHQ